MIKANTIVIALLAASVAVSGCSRKVSPMMKMRSSGTGPDEFAILPTKPIVLPEDYTALPDPTPIADATAALGGNPKKLNRAGIPRGDQGLVTAASRYGVSSNIRTVLADEDIVFRKENRGKLLERLFGVTVYFSAYEDQTLDRYSELKRLRKSGVRTPAAPPQAEE